MPDSMLLPDTGYSLADASILSHAGISASTLPDVLARPAVIPLAAAVSVVSREPDVSVVVHSGCPMPPAFSKGVERVVDLLRLSTGWNSYAAKPVSMHNAARAIRLLAEFLAQDTPPPLVVPTVRGGIQLEWHTKGFNIEIYIESPNGVSFFAENTGTLESAEQPLLGYDSELRSWLRRISKK